MLAPEETQLEIAFLTLRQKYNALAILIDEHKKAVERFRKEDIKNDFQKIQKAAQKFGDLIQDSLTKDMSLWSRSDDTLRHIRHDLRGAIGGVIGYSEIMQETLEDLEHFDVAKSFETLSKVASEILPQIELLSLQYKQQEPLETAHSFTFSNLVLGTVLIVDDSEQKQDLLRRKLEKAGYTIRLADSGPMAIEMIRDQAPDIILLDMYMPDMNGDEVLKVIKKDAELRDVPVLMVSSSSDMDNVVTCIQLGADDYLPMPIDETLLFARLNACLTKKQARDRELETQKELNQARIRLNLAINNIDEGFAVYDENDTLVVYNHFFKEIYKGLDDFKEQKCTYEELVRANLAHDVYLLDQRAKGNATAPRAEVESQEDWIQRKLSYHENPTRPQLELLSSKKWIEVIENKIPGGGIVSIHKDISKAKEKEQQLEYLALHDGLTGLANRKKFDNTLQKLFDTETSFSKSHLAVLFFDLDGFKNVNDTLGHDFGDFLLQEVAKKLISCVRAEDIVARFGGDEFAAIITDIESIDHIRKIADRCLEKIGTSVEKEGKTASFGVSIGIAISPEHGTDAETILKKADEAMYKSKKSGKGKYCIADH